MSSCQLFFVSSNESRTRLTLGLLLVLCPEFCRKTSVLIEKASSRLYNVLHVELLRKRSFIDIGLVESV